MTAGNAAKTFHTTTAGTGEEQVLLTNFHDRIEITNKDDVSYMYVRFDNATAVASAAGTSVIPPGGAKMFGPADGIRNPDGVPGSTTAATACHRINLISGASADPYSVEGTGGS